MSVMDAPPPSAATTPSARRLLGVPLRRHPNPISTPSPVSPGSPDPKMAGMRPSAPALRSRYDDDSPGGPAANVATPLQARTTTAHDPYASPAAAGAGDPAAAPGTPANLMTTDARIAASLYHSPPVRGGTIGAPGTPLGTPAATTTEQRVRAIDATPEAIGETPGTPRTPAAVPDSRRIADHYSSPAGGGGTPSPTTGAQRIAAVDASPRAPGVRRTPTRTPDALAAQRLVARLARTSTTPSKASAAVQAAKAARGAFKSPVQVLKRLMSSPPSGGTKTKTTKDRPEAQHEGPEDMEDPEEIHLDNKAKIHMSTHFKDTEIKDPFYHAPLLQLLHPLFDRRDRLTRPQTEECEAMLNKVGDEGDKVGDEADTLYHDTKDYFGAELFFNTKDFGPDESLAEANEEIQQNFAAIVETWSTLFEEGGSGSPNAESGGLQGGAKRMPDKVIIRKSILQQFEDKINEESGGFYGRGGVLFPRTIRNIEELERVAIRRRNGQEEEEADPGGNALLSFFASDEKKSPWTTIWRLLFELGLLETCDTNEDCVRKVRALRQGVNAAPKEEAELVVSCPSSADSMSAYYEGTNVDTTAIDGEIETVVSNLGKAETVEKTPPPVLPQRGRAPAARPFAVYGKGWSRVMFIDLVRKTLSGISTKDRLDVISSISKSGASLTTSSAFGGFEEQRNPIVEYLLPLTSKGDERGHELHQTAEIHQQSPTQIITPVSYIALEGREKLHVSSRLQRIVGLNFDGEMNRKVQGNPFIPEEDREDVENCYDMGMRGPTKANKLLAEKKTKISAGLFRTPEGRSSRPLFPMLSEEAERRLLKSAPQPRHSEEAERRLLKSVPQPRRADFLGSPTDFLELGFLQLGSSNADVSPDESQGEAGQGTATQSPPTPADGGTSTSVVGYVALKNEDVKTAAQTVAEWLNRGKRTQREQEMVVDEILEIERFYVIFLTTPESEFETHLVKNRLSRGLDAKQTTSSSSTTQLSARLYRWHLARAYAVARKFFGRDHGGVEQDLSFDDFQEQLSELTKRLEAWVRKEAVVEAMAEGAL
ncbi:unnamed protein product [Amoebophrya sp. A25]|nr:unnamed protein product [Amoebophrya sp. A25]|eukprot:GSA25T00025856001.1